jgi:hypothetical protein
MTEDMIGHTIGQVWGRISHKFTQDDNGKWFNERLDKEKIKRKMYVESRSNNKLGKNQHSNTNGHMSSHMENENIFLNNIKEKEVLDDSMWDKHKKDFFNDGKWAFKFCNDKSIKLAEFDLLTKEFISDIELREDYKTIKELKSHFTHWFNHRNKKTSSFSSNTPDHTKTKIKVS